MGCTIVQNFGNNPPLQIYGNTQESFQNYRAFRFEQATCPDLTCAFSITSISSNVANPVCGQTITLTANCEVVLFSRTVAKRQFWNYSGNTLPQIATG